MRKEFWMKIGIRAAAFSFFSLIIFPSVITLQGCAHSSAQREAESNVDLGHINMENSWNNGGGSFSTGYQNTSQTTKGMLIGGAGGALAGGFTSGIGVIPGAATGAILGGALGAYIDHYTTSADRLENRHAKVFVLGDQVMIILPSEHIFDNQTPNIQPNAYSTLDLVAQLISRSPNMSVRVVTYSDSGPPNVTRSLTREQSNSIVKYLSRRGVNTRMIYAVGGGSTNPVSPLGSGDCGENNRVEITLEKMVPC